MRLLAVIYNEHAQEIKKDARPSIASQIKVKRGLYVHIRDSNKKL